MKRIPELRKLSEDHHHGLVLARKACSIHDEASAEKVWQEVMNRFQSELNPHFIIEENYLAPPLVALGEQAVIKRFLDDHKNLRALVQDQAGHSLSTLRLFGQQLTAHIRFEERELFEIAQSRLSIESLKAIEKACQKLSNPKEENAR